MTPAHRRAWQVLALTAVLDGALGLAFGAADHVGAWNGLYFATTTATTVGYGDITPHGWGPHLIAVAIMVTVIPLFTSVFSFFTSGLTASHIDARHDELKRHIDGS